jgi:hypothetical protein
MDWIPRLTPFELEALPRAVESSREDISLTAHSLTDVGQEVKCPICLELMENVMVTEWSDEYLGYNELDKKNFLG